MKLILAGDIMIGRSFNELFNKYPDYNIWGNTIDITKNGFFIANLECTLTNNTEMYPKVFNYKLNPAYSQVLKKGNLSYVSLANNHILDYQVKGMQDTIKTLDYLKISHAGAGNNYTEASAPSIHKNLAIISATDNMPEWKAKTNKPGVFYIDLSKSEDQYKVLSLAQKIKKKDKTLIFSGHIGGNWGWKPQPNEVISFCNNLIRNAGVDIVHLHSAHHVRKIERINNGYILFSNGDFIDDYSVDPQYKNNLSFLADIDTDTTGKVKNIKIIPTQITHRYDKNRILIPQVNTIPKENPNYKFVITSLL